MKVGDNNVIESKGEFRLTVLAPVKVSLGSLSSPCSEFCSCRCWEQEGISHLAVDVPMLQLIALQKLHSHWRAPAEAAWAGAGSGWQRWAVCVWARWCCCLRKCSRVTSAALCAQKPEAELERLTEAGQRHGVEKHRVAEAPSGAARTRPLQGLLSCSLSCSICRQECDSDERLHHRGLLQRQHLRGDPREHRHLRGRLPSPRADRAAAGGCRVGSQAECHLLFPAAPLVAAARPSLNSQPTSFQPQTLQLDFLMKILPNYHHLKKTMKTASTPVKS